MIKKLLLITILFFYCAQLSAQTLYVPSELHTTIQSAINDANDYDTIIVSQGTYFENIDFPAKPITLRSQDPNDPNVVAATIIDGSAPIDPNFGSVVRFTNGGDANSILAGFTLTQGTGSWTLVSWEYKGLKWNRVGGAVLCSDMSAPKIIKNNFTHNYASLGGAVFLYGNPVNPDDPSDPPVHIKPILADNTFTENSAVGEHSFNPPDSNYPIFEHGDGGAIVAFQGCDPIITGNLIKNNTGYMYGGGMHFRQWSNGIIENNQIIENHSTLGGGIHITYFSNPAVKNNLIKSNAAGLAGGGGIYILLSSPIIANNTITENVSRNGAGMGIYASSSPTIRNNLIVNNDGAGINVWGASTPMIYHNTITGNSAETLADGIACEDGTAPVIENNIITSNGNGFGIRAQKNCNATIRYNNIWNNNTENYGPDFNDLTGLDGNISINPHFIDADNNDFHLDYNSKCINAADPNFSAQSLVDCDGQPRIMGQFADLGADEAPPVWNITSLETFNTIQQAIDDANSNDKIVVTRGRYFENIDFKAKQIVLQGPDPNDWTTVAETIIDGNNAFSTVTFKRSEGPNSILTGFTVTGGNRFYGGGVNCEPAAPTIKKNIIKNNIAGYKGGGIYYYGNSAVTTVLSDNIIKDNSAQSGGGVYCDTGTSILLLNNLIAGNYANIGASVVIDDKRDFPSTTMTGNLIIANKAQFYAAGPWCHRALAAVINNTIAGNSAPNGAGMLITGGYVHLIKNNLIAHNYGTGVYSIGDSNTMPMIAEFAFNNVYANDPCNYEGLLTNQTDVNGNTSLDPNFINSGYWDDNGTPADANDDFYVYGNYHILPDSPCVDAGDTNSVPLLLNTDIDSEERVFAGAVDIGADEVVTNPTDLNNDGIIDYWELTLLSSEWLTSDNLQSDLYIDNFIDLADYAELAEQWLWKAGWHH